MLVPDGTANLEIKADGPWHIEVKSLRLARPMAPGQPLTGKGDDVALYSGDTAVAAITHDGQRNFIVTSYPTGDTIPDLLVNVIGPYNGSVRFPGPATVTVRADGSWSISVSG